MLHLRVVSETSHRQHTENLWWQYKHPVGGLSWLWKTGPKIKPYGTPLSTLSSYEIFSPIVTRWVLPVGKPLTNFRRKPSTHTCTASQDISYFIVDFVKCFFLKSVSTTSTLSIASIAVWFLCKYTSICKISDRLERKLNWESYSSTRNFIQNVQEAYFGDFRNYVQ